MLESLRYAHALLGLAYTFLNSVSQLEDWSSSNYITIPSGCNAGQPLCEVH